ncbi:MAG: preprotein translocase subunit YajC [Kiloniellales bacterium]|jgi:preprotein translocase subunit YajC|nr:preprotein translocase subunit YajC [Kiloniellales bacterium]
MLISPAYAQAAGGGGGADFSFLIMMVLLFMVFYFLLIRPQQKKMKQHKAMVEALKRGDKVVTQGGIFGTITKVVSDAEVQVEIAEGVRVRVVKGTISEVLSKPEPAKAKGGGSAANDDKQAAAGKAESKSSSVMSRLLGVGKKD